MIAPLFALLRRLRAPGAARARLGKQARRWRARRRRRGVALILVLSSLTILTVMLSEIQDESSLGAGQRARGARRHRRGVRGQERGQPVALDDRVGTHDP
jgi:hypothetical protein